ncbi:MAG: type II toxin-antitoxin system VapC family toxin [Pseudomonadota bacterium]
MNDISAVLDASAVLSIILDEDRDSMVEVLRAGAAISAVNVAEVLGQLLEAGMPEDAALRALEKLDLDVIPFDSTQARIVARLRPATRHLGLSLGDRACLALGERMSAPVYTADRAWRSLSLKSPIILVR